MSGSAALSAARKRRASGAPLANNGAPVAGSPYYNKGATMVAPNYQPENIQQPYPIMQNGLPPQPMNIHENIELIKQQLVERTKLIQMQGSSLPPEKLRLLQKQNEIQTQILRQKMAIAKQMEMAEQQQQMPEMYERRGPISNDSLREPEFIYEKGVPRKNPKYKTVVESHTFAHNGSITADSTRQLTPFVSMILDTGVVPPPIVVLKSHDAKLEEHNHILHNIVRQLEDIQSNKNVERKENAPHNLSDVKRDANSANDANNDNDNDNDNDGEEDEELLMDVVMNDLTNSREFVEGIVNKIVNETNLSEVIMKIEPLVKENQELRSLIYSQQQMMNEMNMMLFRLLNQQQSTVTNSHSITHSHSVSTNNVETETETESETKTNIVYQDEVLDCDGLYQSEITTVLLSPSDEPHKEEESHNDVELQGAQEEEEASPAQEEEEASPAQEEEEASPAQEEEEASPAQEEDASDDIHMEEVENIEQYADDYSEMPHFPEPISLVVSEL